MKKKPEENLVTFPKVPSQLRGSDRIWTQLFCLQNLGSWPQAIFHPNKKNSNDVLNLYHVLDCFKCFHLLIHQIQQPHGVGTIMPFYRWRNRGTRRVTCPNQCLNPQHRCRVPTITALLLHFIKQQVPPSGIGDAFRRKRVCSSKNRVFHKLSSVYAWISGCPLPFFHFLPFPLSSPNHSAFPFFSLILQPITLHL